jgi:hypothetical protein
MPATPKKRRRVMTISRSQSLRAEIHAQSRNSASSSKSRTLGERKHCTTVPSGCHISTFGRKSPRQAVGDAASPKASELQPLLQAPPEGSGEDRDARGSGIVATAAEAV